MWRIFFYEAVESETKRDGTNYLEGVGYGVSFEPTKERDAVKLKVNLEYDKYTKPEWKGL